MEGILEQMNEKPDYSELTPKMIEEKIIESFSMVERDFPLPTRRIKMYTGAGGMDIFEEYTELAMGWVRVYVGKKVPRILKRLSIPIKKAHTDRHYKLIRSKAQWLDKEEES